ncbi:MAG TPA: HAD-IA family hydrolase [Armatimonadota bacterium]
MPRYSSVLFDLGGTLVYRIVSQERILRILCDEMQLPVSDATDWKGAATMWRAYHAGHSLGCRSVPAEQALLRTEARMVLNHLTNGHATEELVDRLQSGICRSSRWWGIYDDAMPLLNSLKASGLPLAIVSNWEPSLPDFCREMGLAHLFPVLVSSMAEGIEKPSRRIFEIALERMGASPDDCIYIGDDYRSDVIGARAAGLTPVLLDRNERHAETDCIKVNGLDRVLDVLDGTLEAPTEPVVCVGGYSL